MIYTCLLPCGRLGAQEIVHRDAQNQRADALFSAGDGLAYPVPARGTSARSQGWQSSMIRFLPQDNKVVKILFGVIIGAAVISMVWYLVPGLM